MATGTSLLLIAVGAVLAFAVSYQTSGIDIQVVGDILLVVGIIGLLFSLILMAGWFSTAPRDHIDDYGPGHPRDL
jgi:uncharacterized protein DUF6458